MSPLLYQFLPPDWIAQVIFGLVLLLTFGGALVAVLHREIVHNVFGLALSILGIAGLFVFLGTEFLAVMEILIYVGAISIAIVYAVMLSMPLHRQKERRKAGKAVASLGVAAVAWVALGSVIVKTAWTPAVRVSTDWSVKRLGMLFLTHYELMFELISLILLVAIIGAIVTAAVSGKPGPEGEGPCSREEGR